VRPPLGTNEVALLDDFADTLLPRTDTPGARDAGVGPFAARYAVARYDAVQFATLRAGLQDLDARALAAHGRRFGELPAAAREAIATAIDAEARALAPGAPVHYSVLLRQLSLLGFFTSEPGATKVLRHRPVPGRYHGCIPWKPGESSWS